MTRAWTILPPCALVFAAVTFVDVEPAAGQALPADDEVVLPGARPARAPREAARGDRPTTPRRRPPAASRRRRPVTATPSTQTESPAASGATGSPSPAATAPARPHSAGEIVRTLDATTPAAPATAAAPPAPPAPPAPELSCIFQEEEPPEGFPTHGAWVRRRNQFIVACERERTRRAAEARRLREEEERRRVEEARRRAEEEARRRELVEAEARARREAEERVRLEAERRGREGRERRLREEAMIRRERADYRARREAELREEREREQRPSEAVRDDRVELREEGAPDVADDPVAAGVRDRDEPAGAVDEAATEGVRDDRVEPEGVRDDRVEELSSEMSRRLEEELDRQERGDRGEEERSRAEEREAEERERRREARERRAAERAERAAAAARPLPPPILQIEAGLSATTRSQVLDDTGGSTVRFGLTPFASAIGTLRLTPLARLGTGPTGLGIEGTYDRALRMEASLDGKALEASADHLAVMGLYDFRLPGGVVLEPRLGYDLARFELEQNETLSGIVYESIAFAAQARIPVLGDKLLVRFGATMYFLLGLGEAAARYGQSGSASGFSVEGGLEGTVSGHFGYFAVLEHTSYSATFRGGPESDVETTSEDGMTTGLCGARASF